MKKRDAALPRFMTTTQSLAPCYCSLLLLLTVENCVFIHPIDGLGSGTALLSHAVASYNLGIPGSVKKKQQDQASPSPRALSSHLVPAPPLGGYVV